ncbi:hypothetical protein JB92DRAFT_3120975 [Gautieria morchelliformis]|nr:hypothetical protein JB92DRAFT_3120975 [Gautieria morchelliformis]
MPPGFDTRSIDSEKNCRGMFLSRVKMAQMVFQDPGPRTEGSALEEDATGAATKRQRLDEPTSPAQSQQYSNPVVPDGGYDDKSTFEPRDEPDSQPEERTLPDYCYHDDSRGVDKNLA